MKVWSFVRRVLVFWGAFLALAGPAGARPVSHLSPASATPVISEFSSGLSPSSGPDGIAPGPDGAMWFAEFSGDRIGRIAPGGSITEYPSTGPGLSTGAQPSGIVTGPDGKLWFTEFGVGKIGELDPTTGALVGEYALPAGASSQPEGITVGADGALWFTERNTNQIGRIDPALVSPGTSNGITEYLLTTSARTHVQPVDLVTGPDGALWVTLALGGLARVDTTAVSPGTTSGVSLYGLPTLSGDPQGIAVGPDGNLWVAEIGAGQVAQVNPSAVSPGTSNGITEFAVPGAPLWVAAGGDGALWLTDNTGNQLLRFDLATDTASSFGSAQGVTGDPTGAAEDASGNVWFTEFSADELGEVAFPSPPANLTLPAISGSAAVAQTVSCSNGTWTNNPVSYAYRWLLDGAPIGGQTASTHTIAAAEAGHLLSCQVTASNAGGSTSATSTSVTVASPPPAAGKPTPHLSTRRVGNNLVLDASGSSANGSRITGYTIQLSSLPSQVIRCGPNSPNVAPVFTKAISGMATLTVTSANGQSASTTAPFTAPGVASVTAGGHLHRRAADVAGAVGSRLIGYQCLLALGAHPADNVPVSGGLQISSDCELDIGLVQIEGCGLQPVSDLCTGVPLAERQVVQARMAEQAGATGRGAPVLGPCGSLLRTSLLASAARIPTKIPPYERLYDSFYVSSTAVRVNGTDLFPRAGGSIVVAIGGLAGSLKPFSAYLISTNVDVSMGGFNMPISHQLNLDVSGATSLHSDTPCPNGSPIMDLPVGQFQLQNPINLPTFLRVVNAQNPGTPLASLPELPITGTLTVNLGAAGSSYLVVNVAMNRVLNDPMDPDGNVTGCLAMKATNAQGLNVNHLEINIPALADAPGWSIQLKFVYDAPTASFSGSAALDIPGANGQVGGSIEFVNDVFKDAGLNYTADPGGGIPIGGGFYIVFISGKLYLFQSAIPGSQTAVTGDMRVAYGPAFSNTTGAANNNGCGLIDAEGATRMVFYPGPFSVDGILSTEVYCYPVTGRYFHADAAGHVELGFDTGFDFGFIGAKLNLDGQAYFDGQDLPRVQLDGSGSGYVDLPSPVGKESLNVNASISDRGAGFCATVSTPWHNYDLGVGESFIPPPINQFVFLANLSFMYDGCDLSKYQSLAPGGPPQGLAGDARAAKVYGFEVSRASQTTVVALQGRGAPPSVTLRGPGGQAIDTARDSVGPAALVLRQPSSDVTLVELPGRQSGRWTITPDPGSAPIVLARSAHVLPAPRISATVTGVGNQRTLHYSIAPRPGMRVSFLELGRNGSERIGTANADRGAIRFTPSQAASGVREIIAQITQNGLPSPSLVVARYRAARPLPGRASRIGVRYTRGGLLVSFRGAPLASSHLIAITLSDGRGLRLAVAHGRTSLFIPGVSPSVRVLHLAVYGFLDGRRGPRALFIPRSRRR